MAENSATAHKSKPYRAHIDPVRFILGVDKRVRWRSSTSGPLQATLLVFLLWFLSSGLVSLRRATDGECDLPLECAAEDRESDHECVLVVESFERALGEDNTKARRLSASSNDAWICSTQRESSSLVLFVAFSMLARRWCQWLQRP